MWVTDGDGQSGLTIRHLAGAAGVEQHGRGGIGPRSACAGWLRRTVDGWFERLPSFAQVAGRQRLSRMTDSDGRFARPPT